MRVSLDIPDELATSLTGLSHEPASAALEAYRQRRLSGYQLRTLLGIPSRWDSHALLKKHQISLYTLEDVEQDLATIEEFRKKRQANLPA